MRHLIICPIAAMLIFIAAESLCADQATDKAAILESAKSYVTAFNEKNAQRLAAHWSEHGVYQNPINGTEVSGREAIEKEFAAVLAELEGATLDVQVNSVEFMSPSVAVEHGTAHVTHPVRGSDVSEYSAIHVKSGEKWLLDRVTEHPSQAAPSHYERLKSLEWLIGSWVDKDAEVQVESDCQWTKNQNFMTRSFVVKVAGEIDLSGWQIIGWDPSEGRIRSWAFDSDGGFAEGTWINKQDRWIVESAAVLPDGRTSSSVNVMKLLDENSMAWQITGRDVDGEILPNLPEVKVTRVQPAE